MVNIYHESNDKQVSIYSALLLLPFVSLFWQPARLSILLAYYHYHQLLVSWWVDQNASASVIATDHSARMYTRMLVIMYIQWKMFVDWLALCVCVLSTYSITDDDGFPTSLIRITFDQRAPLSSEPTCQILNICNKSERWELSEWYTRL